MGLDGCSGTQGAESIDFELGIDLDLEVVVGEETLAALPRPSLPTYSKNCSRLMEADQAGEAIPYHGSSCLTQVDEVVVEAARSCDSVAAVEAEVQEYKAAWSPSLKCSMEISAPVCIPTEPDSFVLLERVCFGRGSVVLQADL